MNTEMRAKAGPDLRQEVLDELKWEPSVDESDIGVIAKDGIVTLTGAVESFAEKSGAGQAAQRVPGVKGVANEISIRLPGSSRRTDTEIARAAANALQWHVFLPRDQFKVVVEDRWVTLKGEAHWLYEKAAAEDAVRHLTGVRGLTNEITIKPQVPHSDVKGY